MAAGADGDKDHGQGLSVLMLGDGNFSFSLALASMLWPSRKQQKTQQQHKGDTVAADLVPWQHKLQAALYYLHTDSISQHQDTEHGGGFAVPAGLRLLATSFDTESQLLDKYPETGPILRKFKAYDRATVIHEVNAWDLAASFGDQRFDVVAWNHPHLGVEDMRLHRFLLAHFFHSVRGQLAEGGTVSVSLVDGQEERWDLKQQAAKQGLRLVREVRFEVEQFDGYVCKRNTYGGSFKNFQTKKQHQSDMPSTEYSFRMDTVEAALGALAAAGAGAASNVADNPKTATDTSLGSAGKAARRATTPLPQGPSTSESLECEHCHKLFASKRGLRCHVHQVHVLKQFGDDWKPNLPKSFPCDKCSKRFNSQQAVWQHSMAMHSTHAVDLVGDDDDGARATAAPNAGAAGGYKPCPVCGQAVPTHWQISQHLENLKPLVGLSAKCLLCSRLFIEQRALKQHLTFCSLGKQTASSNSTHQNSVNPPARLTPKKTCWV
eukprot:m.180348 g.180348  ORF g.180348 m.180348 type:complete len:492 (+) comp18013_c0_seq2:137-1612(+)